jgi:hypothetical protein
MASRYQNFIKGIGLVPNATDANSKKGDLNVVSGDGKLYYHNGTSSSPSVTEVHASQGANRLKNKDLEDATTAIVDSSDTTKKIVFDAAGSTGTSTTILSSQTSNRVLTLPNATDTLVGTATSDILTNKTLTGNTASSLINGAGTINFNSSGTITVPNTTDTLVGINTADILTNKTISGLNNTLSDISNTSLVNDSITVNGVTIALGGSDTITANTTNALTIGTGLSGTSFNGSSAVTIAIDNTVVTLSGAQSLSSKTLVNPEIDDTLISVTGKDLKINAAIGKNVILQNQGSTIATVASTGFTLASDKELTLTNNAQTVSIKASSTASASYTITLPDAAPVSGTAIVYNGTNYVWSPVSGWSSSIQTSLATGGIITISLIEGQQAIEVAGLTGAVTLSTAPFGGSAPNDKTVVRLIGVSNSNTVTINNSNIAKGTYVNGQAILLLGYVIDFMYISSIDRWIEIGRNF